jgi:hypothetical protein
VIALWSRPLCGSAPRGQHLAGLAAEAIGLVVVLRTMAIGVSVVAVGLAALTAWRGWEK